VVCILDGDRVRLQGQGVLYLRGEISLPDPAQGMTA
jgi:hypothetical protein